MTCCSMSVEVRYGQEGTERLENAYLRGKIKDGVFDEGLSTIGGDGEGKKENNSGPHVFVELGYE